MPSVVVNVVEYERANYGTPGDLLTTITTSHQHIIMMEIVISPRITTLSCSVGAGMGPRGDRARFDESAQ